MVVAIFFALGAGLLFLLVWQWPNIIALLPRETPQGPTAEEIELEARMQVLRELEQSRTGAPDMTEAQKSAAIEAVADGPDESGFTEEEKMDILNSLNAN